MKLLSIDPGLSFTGYAIFAQDGREPIMLVADIIKIKNTLSIPQKIKFIHDALTELITDNEITDIAIETPFLGKNAATFTKLGYIRGIIFLLSQTHLLELHEYAPQMVKKTVTGSGKSDKEAVARVMRRMFPKLIDIRRTDTTDAAAVGMCMMLFNKLID